MNTTPNYPTHLEFTHDLDSHEYLQPKQGYKVVFFALLLVLVFFPLAPVKILSDRNDHLSLDYGTVTLWFLSIAFFFAAIYYIPLCRQINPNKAILWLPAKSNNRQTCLHIRSQNWHLLSVISFFFFFFLTFLCAAYALGAIPPCQVLQPWNWIRITPINIKAELMCLAADVILIILIFPFAFFPKWRIIYTPDDLHIYYNLPLQHRTITTLHTPWEQIATVNLIQCNTCNSDKPQISSIIKLKDGQEKPFKLFLSILADPCWMNFIANTLINLPDTTSRQDFLTNLHQYVPPKAKTRHTKP